MSTSEIISMYKDKLKVVELQSEVSKKNNVYISGLSGNLNVIVPLAITQNDSKSHCFILNDKEKALIYYSNLCNYLKNEKVYFFPYSFIAPYDNELINNANVVMRTEVIQALIQKRKEKTYIVTYPEALFEMFPEERIQKKLSLSLKKKEGVCLDKLTEKIEEKGFNKVDFVNEPGEFASRGNILDVFSYSYLIIFINR